MTVHGIAYAILLFLLAKPTFGAQHPTWLRRNYRTPCNRKAPVCEAKDKSTCTCKICVPNGRKGQERGSDFYPCGRETEVELATNRLIRTGDVNKHKNMMISSNLSKSHKNYQQELEKLLNCKSATLKLDRQHVRDTLINQEIKKEWKKRDWNKEIYTAYCESLHEKNESRSGSMILLPSRDGYCAYLEKFERDNGWTYNGREILKRATENVRKGHALSEMKLLKHPNLNRLNHWLVTKKCGVPELKKGTTVTVISAQKGSVLVTTGKTTHNVNVDKWNRNFFTPPSGLQDLEWIVKAKCGTPELKKGTEVNVISKKKDFVCVATNAGVHNVKTENWNRRFFTPLYLERRSKVGSSRVRFAAHADREVRCGKCKGKGTVLIRQRARRGERGEKPKTCKLCGGTGKCISTEIEPWLCSGTMVFDIKTGKVGRISTDYLDHTTKAKVCVTWSSSKTKLPPQVAYKDLCKCWDLWKYEDHTKGTKVVDKKTGALGVIGNEKIYKTLGCFWKIDVKWKSGEKKDTTERVLVSSICKPFRRLELTSQK